MENNELTETIQELNNNLIIRINEISKLYANQNITEASERFTYLLEDFSPYLETLYIFKDSFGLDVIQEIQDKLQLMMNELENEDFLLISDLLLYELTPLLEDIGEYLKDGKDTKTI